MQALQKANREDKVMQELTVVIATGWPETQDQLQPSLTPYWCFRDELTLVNGMVFRGLQAVVPEGLRKDMLSKVHRSHLGAESTNRMCKDLIFFPGMQEAIRDLCSRCEKCAHFTK